MINIKRALNNIKMYFNACSRNLGKITNVIEI